MVTIENFAPFGIRDKKGHATGFDVDVLNAVAKSQGIQFSYEIKLWSGLLEGLNSDKHDIVSAVVVTPDRQAAYGFSEAYVDTQWALMLKDRSAENKAPFKSFDDAVKNSKVFTTEYGAAGQSALEKIVQENNAQMTDSKSPYMEMMRY